MGTRRLDMGCNSHLTIEVRGLIEHRPDNWEMWASDVEECRDYRLYAAMAGVRIGASNIVPVAEPRGLPADASEESENWHHDHSEHSETWLTVEEFHEAVRLAQQISDVKESTIIYPIAKEWAAIGKVLDVLEEVWGVGNVRLVVGFDN